MKKTIFKIIFIATILITSGKIQAQEHLERLQIGIDLGPVFPNGPITPGCGVNGKYLLNDHITFGVNAGKYGDNIPVTAVFDYTVAPKGYWFRSRDEHRYRVWRFLLKKQYGHDIGSRNRVQT